MQDANLRTRCICSIPWSGKPQNFRDLTAGGYDEISFSSKFTNPVGCVLIGDIRVG